MTNKVNIREIIENAGADHNAPEGSQGWALAQAAAAIKEQQKALAEALAMRDEMNLLLRHARHTLPHRTSLAYDYFANGKVAKSIDDFFDNNLARLQGEKEGVS